MGPCHRGMDMAHFSVDVKRDGSTCTLVISGEVDLQNSDDLAAIGRLALNAVSGREVLVIDLAGVPYMDTTGLGALVMINNSALVNGHEVRLRGVQPLVNRVLELGGLASIFAMDDTAPAQ